MVLVFLFFIIGTLDLFIRYLLGPIDLKTESKFSEFMPLPTSFKKKIIPDHPLKQRLKDLTHDLWQPYDQKRGVTFSVNIMSSKSLNAFIHFGGKILITTQLLKEIKTLNGLSFVLCHELGHFLYRHMITVWGRKLGISLLLHLAGIKNIDDFLKISQSRYSRKHETDADSFAVQCLQKRFGHLGGFDEFFNLVLEKESFIDKIDFMKTHPVTEMRIHQIELMAIKQGLSLTGETTPLKKESSPQ